MLPVWPDGLPVVSATDAGDLVPFTAALATEMEGGNVRVRRRAGMRLATLPWARAIRRGDMDSIFIPFVETTLRDGTMRFRMPVLLGGRHCEVRTVQIVPGSLKYQMRGAKTLVTMSLYVFPESVVN